jgi:hypothetical protein
MLKQPSGTNHFQFRLHQLAFGVGGIIGGVWSTELFYFEGEALRNRSLRCDLSLTHSVFAMQDARHETTTFSPNYFCGCFDRADGRMRDHSNVRSSRARWHMDKLARHRLDDQRRRYISRHVYGTKGRDLGQIYGHRRYDYNSRDSPVNGHPQKLQRARPV